MSWSNESPPEGVDGGAPTIFDKLVSGSIPCTKVFEDDVVLAFRDVNPVAPKHILVIPKQRQGLTQLRMAKEDQQQLLGHLLYVAGQVGKTECPDGFRIVINDGAEVGQTVFHLHLHVIGGRSLSWPPG